MAPTPKRRAAIAAHAELRALQMQLADLHSKRLNALRLYQSEKMLRQSESARADELARQLSELRQERHAAAPRNTLRTEHFDARVRSVVRSPTPSPMVSLTWHCLAMADAAVSAPDVLAILQPTTPRSVDTSALDAPDASDAQTSASGKELPHALTAACAADNATLTNVDTVCSLSNTLSAVSIQPSSISSDPAAVIDKQKSKLNQSKSTCANLLATI
eukprot:TRINITY_DN595_c0_g1_i2.p2 TRINITY_DN595_c0_g1~~TRINITY_DN595_c0_g1_i2.p2  ORF type:complete len:245 (-),score=44.94 TRINITY_DN595_c0_g1_i2:1609-2262(-)